ncbi:MAG: GerMN domain-containing protein [Nocardioides sp.]|nr:GerMN domain-containing protein [Nocardioides sp.]
MTGPHPEDPRLHELLSDAVENVEPQDRLASIRNRTKVTQMTSRKPWILGAGGAIIATAAIITAIAFAGGQLGGDDEEPTPAASSGESQAPTQDPSSADPSQEGGEPSTEDPTATETPVAPESGALPAYYVGDTPQGPRLYREFRPSSASDELLAALSEATAGQPLDPDYRSAWPQGDPAIKSAEVDGDVIRVGLASDSVSTRPSGMSKQDAGLAVQQVVYTAQAVAQKRLPVQFEVDGNPIDQVYGVPTAEPVGNKPVLRTLSMMSITAPAEGSTVSGKFTATGANNSFEATVQWQILQGDKVVKDGFTTAAGWGQNKLFAWKAQVNVSGLEPGEYTFRAQNDDPSGGEGGGPHLDTKTITVK